ncbi:MAG: thioredoxin-dependent thiol peroxidase [Bacteroidetes bacterium]|nr:thioredoxin-dependent thiol peroxidase [Bacteroidota bacterium]
MGLKKLIAKAVKNLEGKFQKHKTSLKAGDKAPVIEGILNDENTFDKKIASGKKIVLYFYPEDNTPGCTAQACSLRDNYSLLLKQGFYVIGVSANTVKKHQNFIKKYELPFPLIADTEKKLIKKFDVWGKKQFMGRIYDGIVRTTFIIDEKGFIEEVISDVDTAEHAKQVMRK